MLSSLLKHKCMEKNYCTVILEPPGGICYSTTSKDLLWSDPDQYIRGWRRNNHGVSYVFGPDFVKKFCREMDLDLIVRAHQVVQDGYEFFANQHLITIFSAPRYCGEFDNNAAVMSVHYNLECSFEVFKARDNPPKVRARNTHRHRSKKSKKRKPRSNSK